MNFQNELQKQRKAHGMSQEELGEKLGVSRQTISKWEGGTAYPDMLNLMTISDFFGITTDELINGKEELTETADEASDTQENAAASDDDGKSDNSEYISIKNHYEYKSKTEIRGIPLIHVNCGIGSYRAKGIIAVGNISTGVISVGLVAKGFLTAGILSLGIIAMGVLSLGLFAIGCIAGGAVSIAGIAVGIMTLGGVGIGIVSIGGCAIATHVAVGGYSIAPVSIGYIAKGEYTAFVEKLGGLTAISSGQVRELIAMKYPDFPGILTWWATLLFG